MSPEQHPQAEALSAYLDGELEPAARQELEAHLGACMACAALLDDLRVLAAAEGGEAPPVPMGLAERIAGRLNDAEGSDATVIRQTVPVLPRRRLTYGGPLLTMAATLLAAGVLWLVWQQEPPAPIPAAIPAAQPAGSEAPELSAEDIAALESLGYVARKATVPHEVSGKDKPGVAGGIAKNEEQAPPVSSLAKPVAPPPPPTAAAPIAKFKFADERAGATDDIKETEKRAEPGRQRFSISAVGSEASGRRQEKPANRILTLMEPGLEIRLQEDGRLVVRAGDYVCQVDVPLPAGGKTDADAEAAADLFPLAGSGSTAAGPEADATEDGELRARLLRLIQRDYLPALEAACGSPPAALLPAAE
jgi:hypothetical protein